MTSPTADRPMDEDWAVEMARQLVSYDIFRPIGECVPLIAEFGRQAAAKGREQGYEEGWSVGYDYAHEEYGQRSAGKL